MITWINVKDRLPSAKPVLVWTKYTGPRIAIYANQHWGSPYMYYYRFHSVTHWAEINQPEED